MKRKKKLRRINCEVLMQYGLYTIICHQYGKVGSTLSFMNLLDVELTDVIHDKFLLTK